MFFVLFFFFFSFLVLSSEMLGAHCFCSSSTGFNHIFDPFCLLDIPTGAVQLKSNQGL